MVVLFCQNKSCGCPLVGKQRRYCSAKCKMTVSRSKNGNGTVTDDDQNVGVSDFNSVPVNVISLFSNELLPLTPHGIAHLKTHLLHQAKYSDEWVQRISGGPALHNSDEALVAQRVLSSIFWRMVDDLQEIEAAQ